MASPTKSPYFGTKRPPKPKPTNPISTAITTWLTLLPPEISSLVLQSTTLAALLSAAPKRWVVYPPLVLLPSSSFPASYFPVFLKQEHRSTLWPLLLKEIALREGKGVLTHLAVNSGIPLHQAASSVLGDEKGEGERDGNAEENILRTPSGLIMLHGDFGPALSPDHLPSASDFKEAFWVRTKQNGIVQVWALRYTMFSRGNVKEKARILRFHDVDAAKGEGIESRRLGREEVGRSVAVDLYAGIGYFVFSYMKMGMRKVVGWELNPWSVEGLRRGAVANGWSIKIVRPNEAFEAGDEKILVFLEDNRNAIARRAVMGLKDVVHVNCGLLPASEDSWSTALGFLNSNGNGKGWLHLHENVGVADIETRRAQIEDTFGRWIGEMWEVSLAKVEHVELVKTFAPGVWHCVFDVLLEYRASESA